MQASYECSVNIYTTEVLSWFRIVASQSAATLVGYLPKKSKIGLAHGVITNIYSATLADLVHEVVIYAESDTKWQRSRSRYLDFELL